MAFIDEEGYLIWENRAFKIATNDIDETIKQISEVFPDIIGFGEKTFETKYSNKVYRVTVKALNRVEKISAVNLFDITEKCEDKKKIEEYEN